MSEIRQTARAEESERIIEAVGLRKSYGAVTALNGIDLQVKKGSVYALLGLNGSGKTTLVKLLIGQIRAQSGTLKVFGMPAAPPVMGLINRRTGFVPENKSLYEYMTPRRMLDLTRSFYPVWDQALINRFLEAFNIPMNRKIRELSKGTRCQLALTLAVGSRPELLILDEPTEGLDPVKRSQFYGMVLDMVGDTGCTVFLTTNNIGDVERIADHVGFITDGRIVLQGETEDLVANSRKVRIAFKEEVENPEFQAWEGISRVDRERRSFLVHIDRCAEANIERLKALPSVFMDVIPMGLEDLFMDLNERGGRHE